MSRLARMARASIRAVADARKLSDQDRADIEHFRTLNSQRRNENGATR